MYLILFDDSLGYIYNNNLFKVQNKICFFFFLTRTLPQNISRFQNLTITFPPLKEREITNTNVVCTKCILL